MWEGRAQRFPKHTPRTREYYLLRSLFEEQFPSPSALATVPKVQQCSSRLRPLFLGALISLSMSSLRICGAVRLQAEKVIAFFGDPLFVGCNRFCRFETARG
jgi:hypothetical protein